MSLWIRTEGGNLFNLDHAVLVAKHAHEVVDEPGKTHYVIARMGAAPKDVTVRLFEGTDEQCDKYIQNVEITVGMSQARAFFGGI